VRSPAPLSSKTEYSKAQLSFLFPMRDRKRRWTRTPGRAQPFFCRQKYKLRRHPPPLERHGERRSGLELASKSFLFRVEASYDVGRLRALLFFSLRSQKQRFCAKGTQFPPGRLTAADRCFSLSVAGSARGPQITPRKSRERASRGRLPLPFSSLGRDRRRLLRRIERGLLLFQQSLS